MRILSFLFLAMCITFFCNGCATIEKIRQPSAFGKALGYEHCKIYGPLNEDQSVEFARKWYIDFPDKDLDVMMFEKSAGEVYFFDCVHKPASGIPSGIIFFGQVKDNVIVRRACEIIEN